MPEQAASKRAKGCVKLRRCSKFKTYYKVQFSTTEENKKRKMGKQIRHQPENAQAIQNYNKRFHIGAEGHAQNVVGRAKKRAERMTKLAARVARERRLGLAFISDAEFGLI